MNKLKSKLKKNTNMLYQYLFSAISNTPISKLTWRDPLGSQVISDKSDVVILEQRKFFFFVMEEQTVDMTLSQSRDSGGQEDSKSMLP